MSVTVKEVTEPVEFAEGPHWDSRTQALYFVNVTESTINKYDAASGGLTTSSKLDAVVDASAYQACSEKFAKEPTLEIKGGGPGFIVPVEGATDQFVVGVERKFLLVQWDGSNGSPVKVLKELGDVDKDVTLKTRITDGKVDPRGRLFAGTVSEDFTTKAGSLYRLDGAKITKVETGIAVSNGLSWDLNEKAFYYTDSVENNIRRYDYDVETGEISNLRYVFDFEKNGLEGFPDGHTIDTDGNLWIALFRGSSVVQVDPRSGKLLRKVPLPALQVTSAIFGGPNLDILYVTSANMNISPGELGPGEQRRGGGIFAVTGLGVRGHPNRNFKL